MATRLLLPQLTYLTEAGYDVRVACTPEGADFSPLLDEFRPIELSFPRAMDPAAMAVAGYNLIRLVRRLKPSIVHFHSPAAALPGRLALLAMRNRPPVVYTAHGYLHRWEASRRDRILERLEHSLSKITDATLLQSHEDYVQARARHYGGRLVHLGNGVPDQWFEDKWQPHRRQGRLHAVFVGRLTRGKGVGELLEVMRRVPTVTWTIIGDALPSDRDPMADAVARYAAAAPDQVNLLGSLPYAEVRRQLSRADIFVLPSYREGLPRSIIEAMACGLPIITTDVRGCRELVQPGVNGWVVPARDAAALSEAVAAADSLPAAELRTMGATSRASAEENHRESDVFLRITQVYAQLGVIP